MNRFPVAWKITICPVLSCSSKVTTFAMRINYMRCVARLMYSKRHSEHFGFNIRVVEIETGPVIAQYEIELEAGLQAK